MILNTIFVLLLTHGVLANVEFNAKIVGGHSVSIEDFPYQLSIGHLGEHICGASIISEDWALTAAHCATNALPSEFYIRAGSTYRSTGGTVHEIKNILIHPLYNNKTDEYDVALFSVKTPFKIFTRSMTVSKIRLTNAEPKENKVLIVSGWGYTIGDGDILPEDLQAVAVPAISREKCNKDYYNTVTESMICAGFAAGRKDACQGDSGGPLVDRSSNVQVGIVSWGWGCAEPRHPGVYANVAYPAIRDWITNNTGVH